MAEPVSYLTFRSDTRHYALPADEIAEIIAVPPVARLPQSPRALLGMANLRGNVIAVASLRGLLGQAAGPPPQRAILLGGDAPVAISVDRIDALISLDAARIDARPNELASHAGERLRGAFQSGTDAEITKILDIQTLLAAAFAPAQSRAHRRIAAAVRAAAGEQAAPDLLISFELAGQEYALKLPLVQEILPLPSAIAAVPRGEALLLGISSLRGRMLPLLSLRGLLGFPLLDIQPETAKIVITQVRSVPVGLVVDRTRAILPAPAALVQPAPAMLKARMGGEARIEAIYRDDSGRVVSILAPETLFGDEVMARLSRLNEQAAAPRPAAPAASAQFLVFRLGQEEFGLPIAAVDEVAAAPEKIARLPKTPAFLEGVINLRGEVLPVIDQRRRFDMPADPSRERRRLLVLRTRHHRAGLLVDDIAGVVTALQDDIEPAPRLAGEETGMVEAVLNLHSSGRMILLLDPEELLSRTERRLLENFAAAAKKRAP